MNSGFNPNNVGRCQYDDPAVLIPTPTRIVPIVIPPGPSYPAIIDLACGASHSVGEVTTSCPHSVFRNGVGNLGNNRYYARACTITNMNPGPMVVIVASEFAPYITLWKNSSVYWTSSTGTLNVTLDPYSIGVLTLEVSTQMPYSTGGFQVDVSCSQCYYNTTHDGAEGVVYLDQNGFDSFRFIPYSGNGYGYVFTVDSGTLPPGLTLVNNPSYLPSGYLTGTPTTPGTYNFVIKNVPPSGSGCSAPFTIVVALTGILHATLFCADGATLFNFPAELTGGPGHWTSSGDVYWNYPHLYTDGMSFPVWGTEYTDELGYYQAQYFFHKNDGNLTWPIGSYLFDPTRSWGTMVGSLTGVVIHVTEH